MDMKAMINEAVEKITTDKTLMEKFQKDPEKAIESIIGIDIPDGVADQVITMVKAKLAGNKLAGGLDMMKKLF